MTSDATHALHIERIDGLCVVGWAADRRTGQPLPVVLRVDGRECPAATLRESRPDVAASLGVADADFGFRLPLPPSVWQAGGQALRALSLTAGARSHPVADPRPLRDHAQLVIDQPPGPAREEAAQRVLAHLAAAAPQPAWPPALCQALAQAARRVRAHIEGSRHGVCTGWAWAEGAAAETLSLHAADGSDIGATVLRLPREDVAQALGSPRSDLGFEAALPPTVWHWADEAGTVALHLHVDGQPATDAIWHWRRADAVADLAALRHGGTDTPEAQAALLHLLGHLRHAPLWAACPPALQDWLQAQARRWGLDDWLPAAATPALRDERSGDTQLLHAHLQALNAQWQPHDADASLAALHAALAATEPGSRLRHALSLAVLPQVCAIDRYAALRPWLDAGQLRALAGASDAWALSLSLPEAVVSGDLALATAALERLASAPGWLNTECVAAAARLLAATWPPAAGQTAGLHGLHALSALLTAQSADFWGRGPDAHLAAAQASVVALTPRLPAADAEPLLAAALRAHGLTPAFWAALHAQWPQPEAWPPTLRAAHARWQRATAAAQAQGAALATLIELAPLTDWPDARAWARCALSQPPAGDLAAAATLAPLWGATEPLRLAAHPAAADAATALDAPLGGLHAMLAHADAHAPAPYAALMGTWLRGEAGTPPATETLRALASVHGPHAPALAAWLATVWAARAAQGGAADAHAGERAAELWAAAWAAQVDETTAHPPQPLIAAALYAGTQPALHALAADWAATLARQAPALWAAVRLPASPRLPLPNPQRATLVVVGGPRDVLDARLAHIRATWGRRLTERGVPWLVVVGGGDGQVRDGVLALATSDAPEHQPHQALALIDWVLAHTDAQHLLHLDARCELAVDAWLDAQPHLAHHHHGRVRHLAPGQLDRRAHQASAQSRAAQLSLDSSPEPSQFVDGRTGWCLSRWALACVQRQRASAEGARLLRGAFHADKLLGDLLALAGLPPSAQGWPTALRQRLGEDPVAVTVDGPAFAPGPLSPTLVCHAGEASTPAAGLTPRWLWPCDGPPALGAAAANALELLSPVARAVAWHADAPQVVAVMRNERVMLPHFLAHYRRQGVRHFVLIDNGSDDGSRAWALAQPDVLLYAAATPYRASHYGVAWQQAALAAHGAGRWSVLVDLDELLIYPDCEARPLADWLAQADAQGADAVRTVMIDMYPEGDLASADFTRQPPFDAAPCHDRRPLLDWHLGSGRYGNGRTQLSALRHRLAPGSAPNFYTAQKIALLRHRPWMRLSDGLHDVAGVRLAAGGACLAHFKYHAGFAHKVHEEVRRRQHFNDAEEYRRYQAMLAQSRPSLFDAALSVRYAGSAGWAAWMGAGDNARQHTPS